MKVRSIIVALAVVIMHVASAASAQQTIKRYLSGQGIDDAVAWEFTCSAGDKSGSWSTVKVPGCWDMQGFGKLSYQKAGLGEQGRYRHNFAVPAEWKGLTVHLVFDGSMTDTQASVNGQSAGPIHQGAYYRFAYDVTRLVKYGQDNLLEVTVDKESSNKSVNNAERRGDYWNYGGIFRPVYLEALPAEHVDRIAINATADGSFAAQVYTTGTTAASTVTAQIYDESGRAVGKAFSANADGPKVELSTTVVSPLLWTAETPNLYTIDIQLMDGGKLVHDYRKRFGFRTIEVRPGDGVYVNGQRILLKGTDRHSFWPETGRATSERLSRADISLMKEMNNNAVRMSHYPPDEHFLDACDEQGLYVLDELAGWHQSYDTPTGTRLIQEMITRDVNHPSILFWDNGNEGGWNTALDDEFAKWDPQQRKVLHPWAKFRGINTKHYPTYDALVKLCEGPEVCFPTEFQHALFDGGGGTGLQDYWDAIRAGKTAAGGFIWAFVDETIKRSDGTMDSMGNAAPDGVLGPYRQKEASFYTIKQVWSPVVVTGSVPGRLVVENRYDFLNTRSCGFEWELRKFKSVADSTAGFTVVGSGKWEAPSISPHASGFIDAKLPATDADAVALRVTDAQSRELWTWVWPLKSAQQLADSAIMHSGGGDGKQGFEETPDSIRVVLGNRSFSFSKSTGYLTGVTVGEKQFPLVNGPRLAVGRAKCEKVEHSEGNGSYIVRATYSGDMKFIEWRIDPSGALQMDYSYSLQGNYDFFGVSFDLPEQKVKSMRWLGNGPFRVWKNRLMGGTLNVWENDYNNTMTGFTEWKYPEFKGYYSGVRWMQIQTTDGPILIAPSDPQLYLQVLKPEFPDHPKGFSPTTAAVKAVKQNATLSANAWASFPEAGFSILHGISPMGTKFNIAQQLGPQSQQNVANGDYQGTVRFYFGER